MSISDTPAKQRADLSVISLAVTAQLERLDAAPLSAGLYLVATPIGNLSDISLRALHTLARADIVYCEDTRQTRKLTERYGLRPFLRSYHEHNAEQERPRLLEALEAGKVIALVSDAGTPLISDPGHKLVREARAAGVSVQAIPGASAALTGLTVSGLEIDRFFFEGFLPPKGAARRDRLAKLMEVPGTLIFYEAPSRLAGTLADLTTVLGNRPAAVTRELTKLYEEHHCAPLAELAEQYAEAKVRGEFVVLVGPPEQASEIEDAALVVALEGLLASMSLRDASRELAEHYSVPRKRVYDLGLAMPKDRTRP